MIIKEVQAKNILTKSNIHHGFSANPYIGCSHRCVYCYAEYMRNWTGHDGERWGEFVDVKNWNAPHPSKKFEGESVFLCSATDAYQPCESVYKRTRVLLEELTHLNMDVTVVTKSKLVIRDIDLLKKLDATVALSINTVDDSFRSDMDNASSIKERIEALRVLNNEGIHTVCFISPVFPILTDVPLIFEQTKDFCDEVWLEHLVLNYPYKGPILYYIKTKHPSIYEVYDEIFNRGNLVLWENFDQYMKDWAREHNIIYQYSRPKKEKRNLPIIVNHRGHKYEERVNK